MKNTKIFLDVYSTFHENFKFFYLFHKKDSSVDQNATVWTHEWVTTLQAMFRGHLIIENHQFFLHMLGMDGRMLDKILAGFQFSIAEMRAFYQKLLF